MALFLFPHLGERLIIGDSIFGILIIFYNNSKVFKYNLGVMLFFEHYLLLANLDKQKV